MGLKKILEIESLSKEEVIKCLDGFELDAFAFMLGTLRDSFNFSGKYEVIKEKGNSLKIKRYNGDKPADIKGKINFSNSPLPIFPEKGEGFYVKIFGEQEVIGEISHTYGTLYFLKYI